MPHVRRVERQARSKPLVEDPDPRLDVNLGRSSTGSPPGEAMLYGLRHWEGFECLLDDGRIKINSNTVEGSFVGSPRSD